jgi:hypothetical protein
MTFDARTLYELLPSYYRLRDAEQGGSLQALMGVNAEQVAFLEEDLAQLYDDQFIETCADWVVPYIGDLVGYRGLHGATAQIASPRAEVADTIALRRRKGTAAALEQLARDVTGWPAHVVEFFRRLAATQHLNHVRSAQAATPDLRHAVALERLGGPFDDYAHTADVRHVSSGRGRYNPSHVGLYLWRLRSNPIVGSPAARLDGTRFFFSPLAAPTRLFSHGEPLAAGDTGTAPRHVPAPLTRREFDADKAAYWGLDKSVFVSGVALDQLVVCNLSDTAGGAWAHVPAPGKVAVDPVLGRIAFGTAPATVPAVSYRYGFAGDLGGGAYARAASIDATLRPVVAVPAQKATLQQALDAVAGGGAVDIGDCGRYGETPVVRVNSKDGSVALRAIDGQRPTVVLGAELVVTGANGSEVTLDGLLLTGGRLRIAPTADGQSLRKVTIRHCTLVPGIGLAPDGSPAQPTQPSLVVETATAVEIDRCILSGIRATPGATIRIDGSIVDATRPDGVAYAAPDGSGGGGALAVSTSTLIGKVHTVSLETASNSLFWAALAVGDTWLAPVWTDRRQEGCARFSYLPPGSRVPRPYRCQPEAGGDPSRFAPVFTSLRYGDPGYGQLSRRTAKQIREGADNGAEMGAFCGLLQAQREANLRIRTDEYLRFGLEAGLIDVS